MLLKTILKKAAAYVDSHPEKSGCKIIVRSVALLNELNQTNHRVEDYILTLGPDDVYNLREYVPLAFPKKLRPPVELDINQNIYGAWRVQPKVKETVNE